MSRLARGLGAATAAYALATLVRPAVLTGPTQLGTSGPADVLTRAVGARDLASGAAIAFAPTRSAMQIALVARIAADLGDAVVFGTAGLPGDAQRKTLAVALGWAALNALALVRVSRRR